MKIFSICLSSALLTFLLGIFSHLFWFYYKYQPTVKAVEVEKTAVCNFPNYVDSRISKSEKIFWNKEILGRFKERPLENIPASIDESYRFTLLPTFDAPVSIRLWRSGNKYYFNVKKLSGEGGFGIKKFGKLSYEKSRVLSEDEWFKFISMLDSSQFWLEPSLTTEPAQCDGAAWIMEGLQQNGELRERDNYHEVHKRVPKAEFVESCDYLLKLAGFETEYEGYY